MTRRSYEATGALFDQQIVKKEKVRFRSRAVMNGFVIYRSMEDITKRRELTLYWQNRRAKGKENTNNRVCADSSEKEIQKSEENIIRYLEEERQLKIRECWCRKSK